MTCAMLFSFAVLLSDYDFLDGCISLLRDNIAPWHEFSRSVALLKPTIYYGIDLFPAHRHFYNLLGDSIFSTSLRNLFGLSSQYAFLFVSFVSFEHLYHLLFPIHVDVFHWYCWFTSTYSLTHHLLLFYIHILTFYNSHLCLSIHWYSSAHSHDCHSYWFFRLYIFSHSYWFLHLYWFGFRPNIPHLVDYKMWRPTLYRFVHLYQFVHLVWFLHLYPFFIPIGFFIPICRFIIPICTSFFIPIVFSFLFVFVCLFVFVLVCVAIFITLFICSTALCFFPLYSFLFVQAV